LLTYYNMEALLPFCGSTRLMVIDWQFPRRRMEKKIGKTGFVEQRSFWNIFRSFDRLWIGYLLVLQVHLHTLACDWGKFVEAR